MWHNGEKYPKKTINNETKPFPFRGPLVYIIMVIPHWLILITFWVVKVFIL